MCAPWRSCAYIWGWPLVNMVDRRAAITQPPCPAWSAASCRSRRADGSPCSSDHIAPQETPSSPAERGRRLRPWLLFSRRRAGGHSGHRFRRSLLGLRLDIDRVGDADGEAGGSSTSSESASTSVNSGEVSVTMRRYDPLIVMFARLRGSRSGHVRGRPHSAPASARPAV